VPTSAIAAAPFEISSVPTESELLAKYFRVFADESRLRILEALETEGELAVGDLVERLGLPQPSVSNHLACLRWCGFVTARREHRTVYNRITDRKVSRMIVLARELLANNAEHVAACRRVAGGPC